MVIHFLNIVDVKICNNKKSNVDGSLSHLERLSNTQHSSSITTINRCHHISITFGALGAFVP